MIHKVTSTLAFALTAACLFKMPARAQNPPREIKLTELQAEGRPKVGWDQFRINETWNGDSGTPFDINYDFKFCNEFIYSRSPWEILCKVPAWADRFTVVGYTSDDHNVKYKIHALRTPEARMLARNAFDSGECRVAAADINIEKDDNFLLLVVQNSDVSIFNHSFWLRPSFYRKNKPTERISCSKIKAFDIDPRDLNKIQFNSIPPGVMRPLDISQQTKCTEFIYAHAPSQVDFEVPSGAKKFKAVGYNTISQSTAFEVRFDNGLNSFVSKPAGVVKIDVKIPHGAKKISLIVNSLGNKSCDSSFWLYPRFEIADEDEKNPAPLIGKNPQPAGKGSEPDIQLGGKNFTINEFKRATVVLSPSNFATISAEAPVIVEGYIDEWQGKDHFILKMTKGAKKESLNANVESLTKRKRNESRNLLKTKQQVLWVYGWILPGETNNTKMRDFNAVIVERPDGDKIASKVNMTIEEINPPPVRGIVAHWDVRVTVFNENSFPIEDVQGVVACAIQQPKNDRETAGTNQVDVGRIEANDSKSVTLRVVNQTRLAFLPTFEGQIIHLIPSGK